MAYRTIMNDTSTATTATTVIAISSSLFLRLPAELRTEIYKLAMEETLTQVNRPGTLAFRALIEPQYLGALALLHTNRKIRSESAREMLPLAEKECNTVRARAGALPVRDKPTICCFSAKCTICSEYEAWMLQRMLGVVKSMLKICITDSDDEDEELDDVLWYGGEYWREWEYWLHHGLDGIPKLRGTLRKNNR